MPPKQNSTRDSLSYRRGSTEASSGGSGGGGGGGLPGLPSKGGGLAASASSSSAHHSGHRHSVPTLENSTSQVRALLEKSDTWAQFDILALEKMTDKR